MCDSGACFLCAQNSPIVTQWVYFNLSYSPAIGSVTLLFSFNNLTSNPDPVGEWIFNVLRISVSTVDHTHSWYCWTWTKLFYIGWFYYFCEDTSPSPASAPVLVLVQSYEMKLQHGQYHEIRLNSSSLSRESLTVSSLIKTFWGRNLNRSPPPHLRTDPQDGRTWKTQIYIYKLMFSVSLHKRLKIFWYRQTVTLPHSLYEYKSSLVKLGVNSTVLVIQKFFLTWVSDPCISVPYIL
jgi:hypothetical protein